MNMKMKYMSIAIVLLAVAMALVVFIAKSEGINIYATFASLAFVISAFICLGLAYKEKKKE